jgi:hypothetical protein
MTPDDAKQEEVKQSVDEKVDKLTTEVESSIPPPSASRDLAKRMVETYRNSIIDYYRMFPERSLDQRGKDNEEWNIIRLKQLLALLDDYEIVFKRDRRVK